MIEQVPVKTVHEALEFEVALAKQRLERASRIFDDATYEVPEGLPPDGSRVLNASRDYARARHDLMTAVRRLNAFTMEGTVPSDLQQN